MTNMAKKVFQFDDEIEEIVEEQPSHDEIIHTQEYQTFKDIPTWENRQEDISQEDDEVNGDDLVGKKKTKKFQWKPWHFICIGLIVLVLAFFVYIFFISSNEGPVYGSRCEGVVEIDRSYIDETIKDMTAENSEIQSLTIEIACKQLKVDILFKDKMKTKAAKSIAEKVVQTLDAKVGKEKDKGKTYSHLFGYEKKVAQYEVNLFLESNDSKDFPIYGTKHVQKDKFSYTLASIKDKESYDKARSTLEEE